jgi:polyisoprenyl-teichoic acid--peptidoglycan teichoic acid transferase
VGLFDELDAFNVLLMGKHGSNVDTLIFAHVDTQKQEVTLISVPRDLYYNGAKINSYYGTHGILAQVSAVEAVLKHRVRHYALIDMYVFRDVVDLLGGIDVTLTQALIDPTYKVCDGERCSTLFYEAGLHHLDGKEALRIARSRHSTSDYSRAERQQLILQGIQERVRSLGMTDAGILLSLVDTVVSSLETDMSLAELLQYILKYQGYALEGGNVISTANVLSAVPVPVDYVTSHPIRMCEDESKPETCKNTYAIDTLQARDGNWNLIPWWVQGVLAE